MKRTGETIADELDGLHQELARKDAEIAALRAALERCRGMFLSYESFDDRFGEWAKMCADALGGGK